ncbi:MAG TPA: hypothetical protein VH120_04510, partial [Gemmataceae bacterium]|nr:hypothetical protein [Gemmataceae bacterium]
MNPRQPTDFPIARGVSPPPRQIHRRPPPRRADTVVERPLIRPVIVRKPAVGRRKPILAVEIGVVVVLSGFCMAAGWWLFHDHGSPTRPVAVREG